MDRYHIEMRRELRDNRPWFIGELWCGWTGKTVYAYGGDDLEAVRKDVYEAAGCYPRLYLMRKNQHKETRPC